MKTITILGLFLASMFYPTPTKMIDTRDVSVIEPVKKIEQIKLEAKPILEKHYVSCLEAIQNVFPADKQPIAIAVSKAESGLIRDRVGAVNFDGSVDYGCFQINNSAHASWFQSHDWQDPIENTKYALQLSGGGNSWHDWSAYNNGAYLKYL